MNSGTVMPNTTVFDDLQNKAVTWSREFERYKEECRILAERMRVEFLEYLGARSTDLEFHVLDEHLDRVKDAGTTLSPRLQVGDDGFVYFGLTLFFKADNRCVDEHIRVGIQRSRSQWRVRWNQVELSYGTAESHHAFFQKATTAIAEKYATPFHKRRGPMGFVPIVSNDHLMLVPPAETRIAAEAISGEADKTTVGSAVPKT